MDEVCCEWCGKNDETVKVLSNPWNACEEFPQCETCYCNAADNARERQGGWNDLDND